MLEASRAPWVSEVARGRGDRGGRTSAVVTKALSPTELQAGRASGR